MKIEKLPKPISNNVLLKINVSNEHLRLENGVILFLDTSYGADNARHTSVNCTVVEVPDRLIFGDHLQIGHSMEWKTQMELLVGDTVIVSYLAVVNALEKANPAFFEDEAGETLFFVQYAECLVAKRKIDNPNYNILDVKLKADLEKQNIIFDKGDYYKVIPLNGLLLCSAITEQLKTTLLLPEWMKRIPEKRLCTVVFAGSCNTSYWRSDKADDKRIVNGMKVIVEKDTLSRLIQPPEHLDFHGSNIYHRVERSLVQAFFEEEVTQPA